MTNTAYPNQAKSFCPLILFHDNPSEQLYKTLTANKQHDQTAINRHRHKINEMLEINAQFWTEPSGLVNDEAGKYQFDVTCRCTEKSVHIVSKKNKDFLDKDMKVSPSITTSNISSSSSSSGDSIATIDHTRHHFYPSYASIMEEEKKGYVPQKKVTAIKSKSTPTASTSTSSTDTTKKRRRGNLPKEVTEFLRKWLIQHKKHPYPAEKEKVDLARHTGLTVNQISNWFINARRRILQPMLESENLNAQYMTYPEMGYDQHRRKRQDFYNYQRDFTPSLPDNHMSMATYSDEESDPRSIYHRRLMDIDEHYQQLSMR